MSILMALAMDDPQPPVSLNSEVPAELSDLVMHLLAKKPEERPESANMVAEMLQEIEEQTAEATPAPARKTGKAKSGGTKQMEAARTQSDRPAKRRPRLPWLVGSGVVGLGVVAAVIILFWPTPNGTVRIESDDPNVEIVFDKNGPTIKGADKEPISLRAGEHGVLIKRGNFSFEADKFVLKKGQTITLKLEWLPGQVQVVQDGKVIGSHAVPLPPTFKNSLGMEFVLVPKGKSWLGGGGGKPGNKEVVDCPGLLPGQVRGHAGGMGEGHGEQPSNFSRRCRQGRGEGHCRRGPEAVSGGAGFVGRRPGCSSSELNKQDKEAGWVYRLPKEVEWEYACRGGPLATSSIAHFDFYFDKPTNQLLPEQANFEHGKGLKRTCKVGSYKPNKLGLYDMHGNVWEWCDDYREGLRRASRRVHRGGSWSPAAGELPGGDPRRAPAGLPEQQPRLSSGPSSRR